MWKTVVFITSRPWKSFALLKQTQQQCRQFELSGIKNDETPILEILRKLGDPNPQQSRIKFQDDVRENNMSTIMENPLMLINAIGIWEKDKSLHHSTCMNYINMLKKFIRGAKGEAGWSKSESRLRLPNNLDNLEVEWGKFGDKIPCCMIFFFNLKHLFPLQKKLSDSITFWLETFIT